MGAESGFSLYIIIVQLLSVTKQNITKATRFRQRLCTQFLHDSTYKDEQSETPTMSIPYVLLLACRRPRVRNHRLESRVYLDPCICSTSIYASQTVPEISAERREIECDHQTDRSTYILFR